MTSSTTATNWEGMSKAERTEAMRGVFDTFRDLALSYGEVELAADAERMKDSELPRYLAGNNAERSWMTRRGEI